MCQSATEGPQVHVKLRYNTDSAARRIGIRRGRADADRRERAMDGFRRSGPYSALGGARHVFSLAVFWHSVSEAKNVGRRPSLLGASHTVRWGLLKRFVNTIRPIRVSREGAFRTVPRLPCQARGMTCRLPFLPHRQLHRQFHPVLQKDCLEIRITPRPSPLSNPPIWVP